MSGRSERSGAVERLIDANANRAREGLRVLEDVARFGLDDAGLCARVKGLRHGLREALGALPGGVTLLLAHRDSAGDVGAAVTTDSEGARAGLRDVALAASRRVTEALRAIEEGAKVIAGAGGEPPLTPRPPLPGGEGEGVSAAVERLRYEAYEVERALVLALGAGRAGFVGWKLCVLITARLCRDGAWERVALGALGGGAGCLQLREKALDGGELAARARRLVAMAREFGADVVVNDRVDVALASGAAGVHLGQGDLAVADARRIAGDRLLIGVSVSSVAEAVAARWAGADSCGVGAMFPTMTKEKDAIAGPVLLGEYLSVERALPPVLAIGGIGPENVGELVRIAGGARFGVAVSSAVCGAEDPAGVCRAILERMGRGASREEARCGGDV